MDNAFTCTGREFCSHLDPRDPSTPTRKQYPVKTDTTPRRPAHGQNLEDTPRPTRSQPSLCAPDITLPSEMRGFTLSYLRRVPDLADMARRVVKAEIKRRARDQRKKDKEVSQALQSRSGSTRSANSIPAPTEKPQQMGPIGPKMKRLFRWVIVQLLGEGSIVLWDGPVHPSPSTTLLDADSFDFDMPWKANVTSSSFLALDDSTLSTIASTSGVSGAGHSTPDEDEDEGALSDPDPNEEAYIPLTTEYFATEVEKAIAACNERRKAPNEGGILSFLKRDDRWLNVTEWAVHEALELLRNEDRAEEMKGKWRLCKSSKAQ